jgi:hypothetical protein
MESKQNRRFTDPAIDAKRAWTRISLEYSKDWQNPQNMLTLLGGSVAGSAVNNRDEGTELGND